MPSQVRQMLERTIETYQTNKRYVRKDGRVVWTQLSGSLVWLQTGEPHYFIYQIQDITDRVRAEQALRASEERFRSIAEATQEWIWEIDADGFYTFCSPAVEAILGVAPETSDRHELSRPGFADNIRQSVADQLQRGTVEKRGWRDWVLHLRHAAGGIRWIDSNALPLFDHAGNVIGFRGVARDITHHRMQQERITRLSRIQAVLERHQLDHRARARTARAAARDLPHRHPARAASGWRGSAWWRADALKVTPLVWDGFEQGYLQEREPCAGGPRGRSRARWARRCATRRWWW